MLRRKRWFRKETAVLVAASAALFASVTWCAFSGSRKRPWGKVAVCAKLPGRCLRPEDAGVRPPVPGGRDPFRPPKKEKPPPVIKGPGPTVEPPHVQEGGGAPPPPPPPPVDEPWKSPVDVWGTYSIRGGEIRALIRSETGKLYTVRDGDEIHDLRLKVVKVRDSVLLIENDRGEQLRLKDLIRPAGMKE